MSKHSINIDVQKMAQDIENIRHFLNHLENLVQTSICEEEVNRRKKHEDTSNTDYNVAE